MQRMISTRLDEAVIDALDRTTRKLRIPKRQFIEDAIRARVEHLSATDASDPWQDTLGAWDRRESVAATIRASRGPFRRTFARHHEK
jgi:hypothetical protein